MAKKRVDLLLVERGLAATRQKAQAVVMAGQVGSRGRRGGQAGAPPGEAGPPVGRGQRGCVRGGGAGGGERRGGPTIARGGGGGAAGGGRVAV